MKLALIPRHQCALKGRAGIMMLTAFEISVLCKLNDSNLISDECFLSRFKLLLLLLSYLISGKKLTITVGES
jgi:hypothetical protein